MWGWQAGHSGEPVFQFQSKAWQIRAPEESGDLRRQPAVKFSLAEGEVSLFVLFRLSVDWGRPIHIIDGNLLYPKFTN